MSLGWLVWEMKTARDAVDGSPSTCQCVKFETNQILIWHRCLPPPPAKARFNPRDSDPELAAVPAHGKRKLHAEIKAEEAEKVDRMPQNSINVLWRISAHVAGHWEN